MWNLPAKELEAGDAIAGYRLEELLGEGGMGLVFRAVRESDGAPVAVKLLKVDLLADETFTARFRQEARAAAEVVHPHLLPILDAGEDDGRHFIAVAYAPGGSLADRLEGGPLDLDEVVRVATEIGSGLDTLNESGIVHRDIKSSNVVFGEDGGAFLMDFGLAKGPAYTRLTRPGQVMGTLDYLAPELIRGQPASPATDIYALGCLAYECVAGKAPFADKGVFQVGLAHLEEEPPDPAAGRDDVPESFTAAVLSALAKDPEQRPSSAGAYAELLRTAHSDRETT
jgi:serine/threonine-protein kinase